MKVTQEMVDLALTQEDGTCPWDSIHGGECSPNVDKCNDCPFAININRV